MSDNFDDLWGSVGDSANSSRVPGASDIDLEDGSTLFGGDHDSGDARGNGPGRRVRADQKVTPVRSDRSRVDLLEASTTRKSPARSRSEADLERRLAEPATMGWRGFLNGIGFSLAPGEVERGRRVAMHKVTQENLKMRAALSQDKDKPEVFAVFSEKGGVGKSTVSYLLAYAFAEFGNRSVGLCEVNSDKGTLGVKTGTGTDKCLPDLIDAIESGDSEIDPRKFMPQIDGLNINVLSGNSGRENYSTTAADVVRVTNVAKKVWPVVVLDNGISLDDSGADLEHKSSAVGSFAVADRLILVTNPDVAEANEIIMSTLAMLERNRHDRNISPADAMAWGELRDKVSLVIVDKDATRQTKRLSTGDVDGVLIGSEDAFEVYNAFQSKVHSVSIVPFDPALRKNPVSMKGLLGRTKKVAMRLAYSLWRDLP